MAHQAVDDLTVGKVTSSNGINASMSLSILAADPASPSDGDMWVLDTGVIRAIRVRISGVTYTVAIAAV